MTRSIRTFTLTALAALAILFPATALAADNTVYVVHGIPGAVVDVYVNGGLALEDYTFNTVVGPLALPPGTYTVEVFLADSDPTASEAVVRLDNAELSGGLNLSLVAALTPGGTPAILPFVNDIAPVMPNFGRLGLRHAADAASFAVNARGLGRVSFANGSAIDVDAVARTYTLPFTIFGAGNGVPELGPEFLTVKTGTYTIGYVVGSAPQGNLALVTQEIPLETMRGARARR
jgi:hypothetical protein